MDLLIRGRKEGGPPSPIRAVQAKSRGSEAHVSATLAPNPNEPNLFSLGSLALRLPQAGQTRESSPPPETWPEFRKRNPKQAEAANPAA